MKHPIDPLLVISGGVTLLALLFIPLLPKHDEPVTEAVREREGLCPACGYDLRGSKNATACPECGKPIESDDGGE